jgi:ketosteroid isomerase-like protein
MRVMKFDRSRLSGGIILLSVFLLAGSALAKGGYQQTKDEKCLVWNNSPRSDEEVTWSGDRDAEKYATGPGTLTWYRVHRTAVTGSNIPSGKGTSEVIARYTGKMVRGKLEGVVVAVNSKGATFHGKFVDGSQSGDWTTGPAPTPAKRSKERVRQDVVAEAPAQSPAPTAAAAVPPVEASESGNAIAEKTARTNDPAQSLAAPPSSLRVAGASESSPQPSAAIAIPTPSPTATPVSPADDVKAVAALDTQYQAAVKANDPAAMDKILADDFVLVTGRGRVSTKADLLKAAREKQMTYERQEEEQGTQKVRVWGDTAVVTAQLWVKGTQEGTPFDYKVWFSDTYARTPKGWRYVFGQASTPIAKPDLK